MNNYRFCIYKSQLSNWWIINIFDESGLVKVYPMSITKEEALAKAEAFIDGLTFLKEVSQ